jgi:hypothetical protein
LSIVAAKAEPAQGYGLPHRLMPAAPPIHDRVKHSRVISTLPGSMLTSVIVPKKVLKKAAAPGRAVLLNIDCRLVAPRSPRPHRSVICGYHPRCHFAPMTK